MKFIIAGFPFFTISAAQHLGAALPTLPTCIIAAISAFWLSFLVITAIQRSIARRIHRHAVRKYKQDQFLNRWNAACAKVWKRFYHLPPSEQSLRWLERNHTRLIRVIDNQTKQKQRL